MSVGENIKKYRADMRMTQEDLAEKLHVTRQTISNWENEKSQPDILSLKMLAVEFERDVSEIIDDSSTYQRYQRQYIIVTVVCAVVIILEIILKATVYRRMLASRKENFTHGLMISIYDMVVQPIAFFSIGVFIPAICSIWRDLRIKQRLRRSITIVSVALFMTYFLIFADRLLLLFAPHALHGLGFVSVYLFQNTFSYLVFWILMPLIAGCVTFLGKNVL